MVEEAVVLWTFTAILGTTTLALVALILAPRPRRAINLALAGFLLVQVTQGFLSLFARSVADRTLSYNAMLWSDGLLVLIDLAYLAFLRLALDIPLLRPLRTRAGGWALLALTPLAALPFLFPSGYVAAMVSEGALWDSEPGAFIGVFRILDVAVVLFALLCSLLAIRHAPPQTTARARARIYAVAFGLQDVSVLVGYGDWLAPNSLLDSVVFTWYVFYSGLILSVCVLAWALLRYQLFDFELKVKLTIRRGTVVGIFLAVFFVAAEIASSFLAGTAGYAVGGVVAGVMLFAIRPLERFADRVANKAMPNVQGTPAYAQFKKLEVYKAAVETALENDGVIDDHERRMLDGLRAKLAIHGDDARAVEAEALALAAPFAS